VSTEPATNWGRAVRFHRLMEESARAARVVAAQGRCEALDSGGARCSADAEPPHEHRYHERDLP